ncbi:hypothetical protein [Nitrobacter sp. Nb-311A]|uniref:hypothetical protein n=1 Tax=Nitrobacter sp. Nb-311A TaxID=314253 RepID=UPI00030E2260|nr:hypothetical protein [Nitrobacter sp. Nb-311A]
MPRGRDRQCKAPYIVIAPVRALDAVVQKHLDELNSADVKAALPVVGNRAKSKLSEFMQRLLNNNESGYFYLDAEDTDLPEDSVAFLNLSIAIKTNHHLQTCIDAKVLQLTDTFQAKLGWLLGQKYSRVGTPDMDADKARKKIAAALQTVAPGWTRLRLRL